MSDWVFDQGGVGKLNFQCRHSDGMHMVSSGGIQAVYPCTCDMSLPLSQPLNKSEEADGHLNFSCLQSIVAQMVGDLKLSVSWDRSHIYFPGIRYQIQLHLLG